MASASSTQLILLNCGALMIASPQKSDVTLKIHAPVPLELQSNWSVAQSSVSQLYQVEREAAVNE
jgi:hypothetical protein